MIHLLLAFIAGAAFMWFLGYRLLKRVYGQGKMLDHVLRNLAPDGFVRLRNAVDAEQKRRNAL